MRYACDFGEPGKSTSARTFVNRGSQIMLPARSPTSWWMPSAATLAERRAGAARSLVRLMLLRRIEEQVDTKTLVLHGPPRVASYTFTELGWEFLRACRDPQTREQVSP
jgi:hypothetical protein